MTKGDLIELVRRRAASGDVPNDLMGRFSYTDIELLLEAALMSFAAMDNSALENMALNFSDLEISTLTITLPYAPLTGPASVKYVSDACGTLYFGRTSQDQNILLNAIKPLATPEWFVMGYDLTFTSTPGDGPYTVSYIPVFTSMDNDTGFIITGKFQSLLIEKVIGLIKQTDNRTQEAINNASQDNTQKQTDFKTA